MWKESSSVKESNETSLFRVSGRFFADRTCRFPRLFFVRLVAVDKKDDFFFIFFSFSFLFFLFPFLFRKFPVRAFVVLSPTWEEFRVRAVRTNLEIVGIVFWL